MSSYTLTADELATAKHELEMARAVEREWNSKLRRHVMAVMPGKFGFAAAIKAGMTDADVEAGDVSKLKIPEFDTHTCGAEDNPVRLCAYDMVNDHTWSECLFCGLPNERE